MIEKVKAPPKNEILRKIIYDKKENKRVDFIFPNDKCDYTDRICAHEYLIFASLLLKLLA